MNISLTFPVSRNLCITAIEGAYVAIRVYSRLLFSFAKISVPLLFERAPASREASDSSGLFNIGLYNLCKDFNKHPLEGTNERRYSTRINRAKDIFDSWS